MSVLIAGIYAGANYELPIHVVLPCFCLTFSLSGLLLVCLRRPFPAFPQLSLLLISVFIAGTLSSTVRLERARSIPGDLPPLYRHVRGVVVSVPEIRGDTLRFVMRVCAAPRDVVALPEASECRKWLDSPTTGDRIQVSCGSWKGSNHVGLMGREVVVRGVVTPPPRPGNPGEFNYARYLSLRGITWVLRARGPQDIEVTIGRGDPVLRFVGRIRGAAGEGIRSIVPPDEAAVIEGVIFGGYSGIEQDILDDFSRCGVTHVLSASGLHVGFIVAACNCVSGWLPVPRTISRLVVIPVTLLYVILTGANPPVVRAAMMSLILILGLAIGRRSSGVNLLMVTAFMMLAYDPLSLFSIGFQLSFAATAGIVLLYNRLFARMRLLPKWAASAASVTVAAQLTTAPLTACYFGIIPVAGILANLIVVPLTAVVVLLGFAGMVLHGVSLLGQGTGWALHAAVGVMKWTADVGASLPLAAVHASFSWAVVAFWHLVLVLICFCGELSRPLRFGLAALMLFLLNVCVWTAAASTTDKLEIAVMDVGQGDAIVVRFPNGRAILVDGGPSAGNWNAGERVIVPFLNWFGISRLDAVLLTHPHLDHFGGLSKVVERVRVAEFIDVGPPGAEGADARGYLELTRVLEKRRVPITTAVSGMTVMKDDRFQCEIVYAVPRASSESQRVGNGGALGVDGTPVPDNDRSAIIVLRYGEFRFIAMGDAGRDVERELVSRLGGVFQGGLTVLKAGHHGSDESCSEEFLSFIDPSIAVISVGKDNPYFHPAEGALNRLRAGGAKVYRTDIDGAILFCVTRDSLEVRCFKSGRRVRLDYNLNRFHNISSTVAWVSNRV